jgi:hypothetical protein
LCRSAPAAPLHPLPQRAATRRRTPDRPLLPAHLGLARADDHLLLRAGALLAEHVRQRLLLLVVVVAGRGRRLAGVCQQVVHRRLQACVARRTQRPLD